MLKKKGDKAVLNYEKKFSKIKIKSTKIFFSNKEINKISKKTNKNEGRLLSIKLKISLKTKIFIL